jgi:hypothetical protein
MKDMLFEADGAAIISLLLLQALHHLDVKQELAEDIVKGVLLQVALWDAERAEETDPESRMDEYAGLTAQLLEFVSEYAKRETHEQP